MVVLDLHEARLRGARCALGGSAGPFTVEVDTVCDWTVEVLGTP